MSGAGKKEKPQPIHVYLRIRPVNKQERDARCLSSIEILSTRELAIKQQHGKKYCFEKVFGPTSTQIDVYLSVVRPLIPEVLAGYNCTVFAYGQTGTGKTYTMAGGSVNSPSASWHSDEKAGIIPRALAHLFEELRLQQQQEFTVRVSYLELYNEDIFDLLSDGEDSSRIRIYEDQRQKGSVIVQGIEEVTVCNKNEVYKILEKGQEKRRTAATLMNAQSSRSHTVFCITVYARETTVEGEEVVKMGKLNLVDLAGSENINRSGAVDVRAREAGSINQSLLTLGRCIKALVERSPHVPYRESKLTRILQDSLGGRTKTSIIATISPTVSNLEETVSTLDYAHRARNITNRPEVNQRLSKRALICQYTEEIERLRKDLNAAHCKSGIYLAQENYDRLLANCEYQKEELAEKIVIIRDLQKKIQFVEQEKALKEKEWEDLSASFKIAQEYLAEYVSTEKVLKEQAETLLDVVEKSTTNESKLHEKVDYFYEVTNKNKENTNKLMEIVDENVSCIAKQMEEFYKKSSSQTSTLMDIIMNSEQLVGKTLTSLGSMNTNCREIEGVLVNLQGELDENVDTINNAVKNTASTSQEIIQIFKSTFEIAMQNHLRDITTVKIKLKQHAQGLTDFISSLSEQIDNARINLIASSDVLIKQTGKFKKELTETKGEILKTFNKLENITSEVNTFDYEINEHGKELSTVITEINKIVEEKYPNIDAYIENSTNAIEKVNSGSFDLKYSVDKVLQTLGDGISNRTFDIQESTSNLKNNYNKKIQSSTATLDNAMCDRCDAEKFVTMIDSNTRETLSCLDNLIKILSDDTEASKQSVVSCNEEIKKVLTEELITVEPTGRTPIRTQFQFPKKIVSTSLKDCIMQKFKEDIEVEQVPKLPLLENNASSLPLISSKSNGSSNIQLLENKENIPKDEVQ